MTATPATSADKFTFGWWTVGWPARDPSQGYDVRVGLNPEVGHERMAGLNFVHLNQLALEHLANAR